MKRLDDRDRTIFRDLLLGLGWEDESLPLRKADQWATDHVPWIEGVRWGQWEGLRRQGEEARVFQQYIEAVENWLCEQARDKAGAQKRTARRAWSEPGLKDSLLRAIEESSKPPDSPQMQQVKRMLEEGGFSDTERNGIDQILRVRRARRFVELLGMRAKTIQEARCLASIR
jgi:hypothetical protein